MSGTVPQSVLVVGRGLYALQLIRAYDNAGCKQVYLATSAKLDFARGSLSLTRSFLVAKPDSSKPSTVRKFSNDIQRLGLELDIELIVPAAEEGMFVSLLAPQWHANGLKAAVLACPFALMDQLHDKYRFQKMCEKRVKTPKSELATSHAEVLKHAEAISKATGVTRIVVKPVYTRGGRSMWFLDAPFSIDALKNLDISGANPFVVQQFISGQEYSSYSVVSQGRILAHVCYKCDFPIKVSV
jgi:biotin carboxylase